MVYELSASWQRTKDALKLSRSSIFTLFLLASFIYFFGSLYTLAWACAFLGIARKFVPRAVWNTAIFRIRGVLQNPKTTLLALPAFIILKFRSVKNQAYGAINSVETAWIRKRVNGEAVGQSRYSHSAITTSREIRLLRLHPRRFLRGPRGELLHFHLDNAPPFEAISYVWGSPDFTECISIGDHRLAVTRSVFEILRGQQSFREARLLWVDSICINQQDTDEKSGQVQMMADIYGKARKVIVCLGDADDDFMVPLALSFIARGAQLRTDWPQQLSGMINQGVNPFFGALVKLFRHPWFTRSWVIQEVVMAKDCEVQYGQECFKWELMALTFSILMNHKVVRHFAPVENLLYGPESYRSLTGLKNAIVMEELRRNQRECDRIVQIGDSYEFIRGEAYTADNIRRSDYESFASLGRVLEQSTTFSATDSRDKIFAFLGLTTDGSRRAILPDYNRSVEEVYCAAMRFLLSSSKPFFALPFAGIGYLRSCRSLPSWVPDWSCNDRTVQEPGEVYIYKAALGYASGIQFKSTDPQTLYLKARIVDKVNALTAAFNIRSTNEYSATRELLVDIRRLAMSARKAYHGEQFQEEVLWRTLIGDLYDSQRPAPPSCGENYRAFEWYLGIGNLGIDTPFHLETLSDEKLVRRGVSVRAFRGKVEQASAYIFSMGRTMGMRVFCLTEEGYTAVVPPLSKEGDLICIVAGLQWPCLLRQKEQQEPSQTPVYELVGICYVHGMMDGELANDEWDWITLV
jgi:hypothetical protein